MPSLISTFGGRRRTTRRRRVGRGFLDILRKVGDVAGNIASSVGTKYLSNKLGLGRRRRRRTGKSRLVSVTYPGARPRMSALGRRRVHRRPVRRGRGPISAIASLFGLGSRFQGVSGLGKRRVHHRRHRYGRNSTLSGRIIV